MNMDDCLYDELCKKKQASLYRRRKIIEAPSGEVNPVYLNTQGKTLLSFCSNDYLGLAHHPKVVQQFQQGVNNYGAGSGAAHLVSGHSRIHHQLEDTLADYTGRDRALLFSTGYMANLGIVSALMGKRDIVYQDKLNHASLIDAALLSSALSASQFKRYPHNNMISLNRLLEKKSPQEMSRKLVMSDSVFSMDGDLAEVIQLVSLCRKHDAWLMLDDAHGFGVLGKTGAGIAEEYHLDQQQLPVYMATLGKAMGVFGAFVAGSDALIETLIQQARPYIYTTAMPPALAQALLMSIKISREESWRREKLKHLIKLFRSGAEQSGLSLMNSSTPIQPILIGENESAMQMSRALEAKGILVTAIRPPTVPENTARLRITLSAEHSEKNIEQLLSALNEVKFLCPQV